MASYEFESLSPVSGASANANTVTFRAQFTDPVIGVTAANFEVRATGLTGAAVQSVTVDPEDPTAWLVTVGTGSGSGSLRLALDLNGITTSDGFPLDRELASRTIFETVLPGDEGVKGRIVLDDINGDGLSEIVVTGSTSSGATAYHLVGVGNGDFNQIFNSPTLSPSVLASGDLDGDGIPETIVHYEGPTTAAEIFALQRDAFGNLQGGDSFGVYPEGDVTAAHVADLDGTPGGELVVAAGGMPRFDVLDADGTLLDTINLPVVAAAVASLDVDGDGDQDLAVALEGDGQTVIFANEGAGTFYQAGPLSSQGTPTDLVTGDVNGDGAIDLVSADNLSNTVTIYWGGGSGLLTNELSPEVINLNGAPDRVALGDVDGNGSLDIVATSRSFTEMQVLLNSADGPAAPIYVYLNGLTPTDVAIGRITETGNNQIVVTGYDGENVTRVEAYTLEPELSDALTIDREPPATPTLTAQALTIASPAIGGTAEANATVTVREGETLIGTTTADEAGVWSLTPSSPLSQGTHTLTATAADSLGNESAASGSVTILVDTVAPTTPTLRTAKLLTAENRPLFAGLAEVGSTVEVLDGATIIGTVTADASGNWVLRRPMAPLGEGPHTITARAKDAVGNESLPATLAMTVDTLSPVAPAITSAHHAGTNLPTLAGTAEALGTVKLYDGTTLLGTVTADENGAWSLTLAEALEEGAYELHATATDAVGHVSPLSAPHALTVDLTAPATPTFDPLPPLSASVITALTGTAEPGVTIEVLDGTTSLGTVVADAVTGIWSLPPSPTLTHGNHSLTVIATDLAGNVSEASSAVAVEVDTVAPLAPVVDPILATSNNTPEITGTAEAGSTVEVLAGASVIGTDVADDEGRWSVTPETPLADGPYDITARAKDAAANLSVDSAPVSILVDTTPPAAPTITAVPQENSDTTPVVFGTAEADAWVEVFDGDTSLGRTQADADGDWVLIIPTPLEDGKHLITAKAADAADNTSEASPVLEITINAGPPAVPVITHGETPLKDPISSVSGTGEAGSTVTLSLGLTQLGTALVDAEGNWTVELETPLVEGLHTLTAIATDPDDLASEPGTASIEVDLTAPGVPLLFVESALTSNAFPTITGSADFLATVEVYNGETLLGTVTAGAGGAWSFTPSEALADGEYALTAKAIDRAGNVSLMSGEEFLTIDTLAPETPTVSVEAALTNQSRPVISGTAEAGAEITVYDGETEIGRVTAEEDGAWSLTPEEDLADGLHWIAALATDAAGNYREFSTPALLDIDTVLDGEDAVALTVTPGIGARAVPFVLTGLDAATVATITVTDGTRTAVAEREADGSFTVNLLAMAGREVTATVALQDAAGNQGEASLEPVPFTVPAATARDHDGDGRADFLWQHANGQAAIWTMDGATLTGGNLVGPNPGAGWVAEQSADFDGDGRADILWQHQTGLSAIWTMDGTTITGADFLVGSAGAGLHVRDAGDFDGDGKADILWQDDTGQAFIWRMDGTEVLDSMPVGPNPGPDWQAKAAADFDGDGRSEILWQHADGRAGVWWLDGTTLDFADGLVIQEEPLSTWHIKGAADFDGDGRADILWQDTSGQAAIWTMGEEIGESLVGPNPGVEWHVRGAADVTGDGKADILWQHDNGQAAVWTMDGVEVTSMALAGDTAGTQWHLV